MFDIKIKHIVRNDRPMYEIILITGPSIHTLPKQLFDNSTIFLYTDLDDYGKTAIYNKNNLCTILTEGDIISPSSFEEVLELIKTMKSIYVNIQKKQDLKKWVNQGTITINI